MITLQESLAFPDGVSFIYGSGSRCEALKCYDVYNEYVRDCFRDNLKKSGVLSVRGLFSGVCDQGLFFLVSLFIRFSSF